MYYYIFGGALAIIIVWAVGSYLVVWSIEEPVYTIIEKKDGYEIRRYDAYIVAETVVTGNYDDATSKGFSIIADYIFGNNLKKESIAMTAPVLESGKRDSSEKIAMTVPVLESSTGAKERRISFVLPSKYTLETLPVPNNSAVTLTRVPEHKVAVLRFSWYPTEKRVEGKKEILKNYLMRDGVVTIGEVETARYNPPLSMPLLLRNEILVEIE